MHYLDEYRDPTLVSALAEKIKTASTKAHCIMEICGGQTHSIVKYGLDQLLPAEIELIHGPGCPVCVTDINVIDKAIALAQQDNIILCSFGDMLRVPGSDNNLLNVKATGADIRTVYSPLDALNIADAHPEKETVFLGVGFETTAPATALTVLQAEQKQIDNFSLLVSHVLVPPAIDALLSAADCRIEAFLAAGHVCSVMGFEQYHPLVEKYHVPIIVTGFEPADILQGILMCVEQLEANEARLENQYTRAVNQQGNKTAQHIIGQVFEVAPQSWRGIGNIAASGLRLRNQFRHRDAESRLRTNSRLPTEIASTKDSPACISGEIMQGLKKPLQCSAFGKQCTPEHPLGAPMVSSEGACAAYYRYRQ